MTRQFDAVVAPLDFVTVVNVPSGPGMHFMSTLAVASGNLNFLEGCYRAYVAPSAQAFPGIVLSTGTEVLFFLNVFFHSPCLSLTCSRTTMIVAGTSMRASSTSLLRASRTLSRTAHTLSGPAIGDLAAVGLSD